MKISREDIWTLSNHLNGIETALRMKHWTDDERIEVANRSLACAQQMIMDFLKESN